MLSFFIFDSCKFSNFILFQLKYRKTQTMQFSLKLRSVPHRKQPATSVTCCHSAGGKFSSSPVIWFIQWQASDHQLMSFLITLACRLQSGRMHRSQFCSQEQESCWSSYTRWHGRTKFRHPQQHPMANSAAVLYLTYLLLVFCRTDFFFFYLITWHNFIEINAKALLRGVP